MVYVWLAILPSLIAIVLSMITKRIIPSLLIGLWVGSFLVSPGILSSVSKTVDYILVTLLDRGNMLVLLFLYFFSGFVGLLKLSGGIKGFAKKMEKYIKTPNKALLSVWGLIPVTFIDCGFHVVATGAMLRPIVKKLKIAKEKLAVMLNFSASPIITLIPIATTFVAFLVGVIDSGLKVADIQASAYTIFLQSIPFNIFSIVLILITIFSLFSGWKFFEGKRMEKEMKMKMHPMVHEIEICPEAKFGVWNLIIPIGILIFLSFFLMYWDGIQKVPNAGILEAFIQSDAYTSMFLAMFISTIIAAFLYFIQRIHMKMMVNSFLMGGNRIMKTIAILLVAWPIASVSKDLGLPQLITSTVGTTLPSFLVAVIIFLVSSGVAYSIGSSWGTFALIMPIGIPLAYVSGASIPLVAGAVFAGGTFGDVSSPLSGMVAMSSNVAETSHANYIGVAKRYTFLAMGISAVLYVLMSFIV